VYDFWLSPGISHPTGNKSDIKRERLGPDIYFSHMAQVIEKTQTDAYIDTGDIDFLKIRTVGDSGDLRDKYVEITTHLLLGDAGKLS
jgi:hypothetical protein